RPGTHRKRDGLQGRRLTTAAFPPFISYLNQELPMNKPRNAKYWNEFKVGEIIETGGRTIESGDVNLFAGLSGDFNPNHVDQVYAETKGLFGSRIGHGLLTLAVTSGQM